MSSTINTNEMDLLQYWENEARKMHGHKRMLKAFHWVGNLLIICIGISIYPMSKYQLYVQVAGFFVSILSLSLLIMNIEQRAKRLENYSRDLVEFLYRHKGVDLEDRNNKEAMLKELKEIRERYGFAPN